MVFIRYVLLLRHCAIVSIELPLGSLYYLSQFSITSNLAAVVKGGGM